MKKLLFTKGDETRPKLENLRDEEILKSSIFADIYDSAFSLIKEISESTKEQNNKNNRERNNIIAFIGERGSRTFRIIENHKISIHCKLSVYKFVKFIEVHRVHFDI